VSITEKGSALSDTAFSGTACPRKGSAAAVEK
jgi:hypothetical protein